MGKEKITLKEFLLAMLQERDKLREAESANLRERIEQIRHELDNEVPYMPREEYREAHASLETRLAQFVERLEALEGRTRGRIETWSIIVTVLSVVAAIATFVIEDLLRKSP